MNSDLAHSGFFDIPFIQNFPIEADFRETRGMGLKANFVARLDSVIPRLYRYFNLDIPMEIKTEQLRIYIEFLDCYSYSAEQLALMAYKMNQSQLEPFPELSELKGVIGTNPVVYVCRYGYLKLLKYLKSQGNNIYERVDQIIPLASSNGHLNIIEFLVSLGADIRVNDDEAIRLASGHGWLDVVKYFQSRGSYHPDDIDNLLLVASKHGHLNVVQYWISVGAKVEPRSLILSCSNGRLDMV